MELEEDEDLAEYDQDLLREQILLLDTPAEIKDYIETEALVARRPLEQLKLLSLGLMVLARERVQGANRALSLVVGERELMSR